MNEIILKNEEYLEMSNNIYNEFSKIRIDIVKTFFTKYLVNYFEQKFDNNSKYKDWSIKLDTDIVKPNFYAPIRIGKKNWNIIFKFAFDSKDLNDGYYGISIKKDGISIKDFRNKKYNNLNKWKKNTTISLFWDYTPRKKTYDSKNIVAFQFQQQLIAKEYFELFEETLEKLEQEYQTNLYEINKELDRYIEECSK
jgi:hypothetical protein